MTSCENRQKSKTSDIFIGIQFLQVGFSKVTLVIGAIFAFRGLQIFETAAENVKMQGC